MYRHVPLHTASEEKEFCKSTLPSSFRDVSRPLSRMVRRPPPQALPAGMNHIHTSASLPPVYEFHSPHFFHPNLGELGFTPSLIPHTRTGLEGPSGIPTIKTMQV